MKRYRVLFLGLTGDRDRFTESMAGLGLEPHVTREMLQRAPILLKRGMELDRARRYAEAIREAGGEVAVQEDRAPDKPPPHAAKRKIMPLEHFTLCAECGHKQPRSERCVRCGRVLGG